MNNYNIHRQNIDIKCNLQFRNSFKILYNTKVSDFLELYNSALEYCCVDIKTR